jgi:hypothetical protein
LPNKDKIIIDGVVRTCFIKKLLASGEKIKDRVISVIFYFSHTKENIISRRVALNLNSPTLDLEFLLKEAINFKNRIPIKNYAMLNSLSEENDKGNKNIIITNDDLGNLFLHFTSRRINLDAAFLRNREKNIEFFDLSYVLENTDVFKIFYFLINYYSLFIEEFLKLELLEKDIYISARKKLCSQNAIIGFICLMSIRIFGSKRKRYKKSEIHDNFFESRNTLLKILYKIRDKKHLNIKKFLLLKNLDKKTKGLITAHLLKKYFYRFFNDIIIEINKV